MSRLSDRTTRRAAAEAAANVERAATDGPPVGEAVGIQPRSLSVAEAEEAYTAARAAWLEALRHSASGNNRALAKLAIAQEAYEAATKAVEVAKAEELLEQQRLEALRRRREELNRRAEAIAGQAAAWDRVHEEHPRPRGFLGRIFGRR
jgi:hypothetical protein